MGRHIVRAAGIAASAALLLTACGGGTDPTTGAGAGGAGGAVGKGGGEGGQGDGDGGASRTASLTQPDSITVAFCQAFDNDNGGGGTGYQVVLRSFAAKDGAFVGERSTTLQADAEPAAGCDDDGPDYRADTAFNKDLTLVAGLVNGDRAAAFEMATGREVGAPDPDSFTKRPDSRGVAFHPETGRLWYDMRSNDSQSDDPLGSRDPKGGLKTEEKTSFEKIPELLEKDGPSAVTTLATDHIHAVAVPAGGIVATGNTTFGVRLSRVDRSHPGGGVGAGAYLTDIATTGLSEDDKVFCEPAFWRNATTLVCDFQQLTFSADYKKLLKTENIIPENDRINGQPVLSPDGKSFAFLSKGEDGRRGLFRGDFSGGEPVKITSVDPPVPDADDRLSTTLIRWN